MSDATDRSANWGTTAAQSFSITSFLNTDTPNLYLFWILGDQDVEIKSSPFFAKVATANEVLKSHHKIMATFVIKLAKKNLKIVQPGHTDFDLN